MIGSSNRENYLRKCFWTQEKEIRVNFNPRLSANRPSNNWALGSTGKNFSKWNLKVWLLFLGLKRLASESDLWREFYWSEPAGLYWPYVTLMLFFSSVECVFASTQYQNNNGPVSIPKTIFSHWKLFLVVCWYNKKKVVRMARIDMDWDLKKLGKLFQV